MDLHFLCAYYPQWAHVNLAPRTQQQWDAFKFCRAVKNRRINGSLKFPLKPKPEIITEANVGRARAIFGRFIEVTLEQIEIENAILIPFPSKDGILGAASFRSLDMLTESISSRPISVRICPVLRFNEQLKQAHAGGPRGRAAIYPYLTLSGPIPNGEIVLVDDLVTTGGSIMAAQDILREHGHFPSAAISCGLTVSDSLFAPFGLHSRPIDADPDDIDF